MSDSAEPEGDTMSEHEGNEGVTDESREQDPTPSTNTYGGLLQNGEGTNVGEFVAVSVGLDRFVQPRHFASLIFAASEGKMPWISSVVPQKVMVNSVFVVDTKSVESDAALLRDGLGAWIQNCGKVINHYVYDGGQAKEVKPGQDPESYEFIRRIDKNANCNSYTRVIVHCPQLGLAAYQYFFKGEAEHEFDISYKRPKKTTPNSPFSLTGIRHPSSRPKKRKVGEEEGEVYEEEERASEVSNGVPLTMLDEYGKAGQAVRYLVPDMLRSSDGSELPALIGYLKSHLAAEKQERMEERKLRREEIEVRRKERAEDRQLQKEEMELRKEELKMQKQKWEIDCKERNLMYELIRKKLVEKF